MERTWGLVRSRMVRPLPAVAMSAALIVTGLMLADGGGAPAGAVPAVQYDVAMGDSLGAGTGASVPANDYVNLVFTHELALHPGL